MSRAALAGEQGTYILQRDLFIEKLRLVEGMVPASVLELLRLGNAIHDGAIQLRIETEQEAEPFLEGHNGSFMLGASTHKELIGVVSCMILDRHDVLFNQLEVKPDERLAVMHHLVVLERHRRRGAARWLLAAATMLLREAGIKQLAVNIGSGTAIHRPVVPWLERLGFEIVRGAYPHDPDIYFGRSLSDFAIHTRYSGA